MKKIALVTGGSRGIGLGIADELACNGYDLVVSGRREESEVVDSLTHLRRSGAEVIYCVSNISLPDDRARLMSCVRNCFGRLDLLVNNAGVAPKVRSDILDASVESFEYVMKTNLQGPFFLTQAVASWMLEQKALDDKYSGTIINISSISADVVSLNRSEYCMSKAGMSMMTKLFAARLADNDINVFEIRPGIVKTDMTSTVVDKYNKLIFDGNLCVVKRWGYPADVGAVALTMASGKLPYCVGQVVTVDGGLTLSRL